MAGDFNIRNWDWDLSYPHYLAYNNILIKVADSQTKVIFLCSLGPNSIC